MTNPASKFRIVGPIVMAVMIAGCAPRVEVTETQEPATEEAQAETDEPATATEQPTSTPRPSATATQRPTNTPKPTATEQASSTPEDTEPEATATSAQGTSATEEAADLVPAGTTIWVLDTAASETGSSDKCPAPFYADFYGLVRIDTINNGITWQRAQDGITYTLLRQSPNVYWGTGQSIYPGYTLTVSAVFASPTGLGATFVLIDQSIEGCNHYWKYGGTLR